MQLRDHVFLGLTQSLCPDCLAVVPAKIIERRGRIYFRKRCPTHGERDDFICSDRNWYDRMEFGTPGKVPRQVGVEPNKGCPYDCGLCTDHEQHTCVGLVEITDACNLSCPMCYASSLPGQKHKTFEECKAAIDRLVEVEGRPEVLQLSGGEPTIHPEFERIFEYGCEQPIDIVMINTNGLRIARDKKFVEYLKSFRQRIEIYLQFDGFDDEVNRRLRGEELLADKLKAVEALGAAGIRTILVATLQAGVNDDQIGAIVKFGMERPWITGISLQPATYSGRFVLPRHQLPPSAEVLERRITFPDVIKAIVEQTDHLFEESDFMPLPCAHPNCHQLTYAYRFGGTVIPLTRFIDAKENLDLLANGITFTRPRARQLIERYLGKLGCCAGGVCDPGSNLVELGGTPFPNGSAVPLAADSIASIAQEFFTKGLDEDLNPEDVFRITLTSFLDAYNFDVRRLMKCCIHHVLPSGHVVPFCAYNVLYRNGHVTLPELIQASAAASS